MENKIRYKLKVYRSLTGLHVSVYGDPDLCMVGAFYKFKPGPKPVEQAVQFGEDFAQKAKLKGVKSVAFYRGKNLYHGRIKAFAEGLRRGGLEL